MSLFNPKTGWDVGLLFLIMIIGTLGFSWAIAPFLKETLFFLAVICPIILSLVYSFGAMVPFGEEKWKILFVPLAVLSWFMSLGMAYYAFELMEKIF